MWASSKRLPAGGVISLADDSTAQNIVGNCPRSVGCVFLNIIIEGNLHLLKEEYDFSEMAGSRLGPSVENTIVIKLRIVTWDESQGMRAKP